MTFDSNNPVIKLCALGMEKEGDGKNEEALKLFEQAWNESRNDFEKFTSAHYVARHQKSVADKLFWDETALKHALQINESNKGIFPSLYLNIAKCYEDLKNVPKAKENYEKALFYVTYLPQDGYGNMIRKGIENGIKRIR